MKHLPTPLLRVVAVIAFTIMLAVSPTSTSASPSHAQVRLQAVGGSGVSGIVHLKQLKGGGTQITLVAFGLKPGGDYLSLYYGNHVCNLEPYSASDVIGGIYTANRVGVGTTRGAADDDLDEINSVSVRTSDFGLVACADVHPGH